MPIRTDSYLRRAERDDLDTIVRWMEEPDFQSFLYGDPARSPKQVREQIVTLLGRSAGHTMPGGVYLVVDSPGDGLLGMVSLQNISWRNRSCSIDVYVAQPHRGKGVITAVAIYRALEYCFDELNLHRVSAFIYAFNRSSWRIFEMTGATRELVLRDHVARDGALHDMYAYGLLRPEFEALRAKHARHTGGGVLAEGHGGIAGERGRGRRLMLLGPENTRLIFLALVAAYLLHALLRNRHEEEKGLPYVSFALQSLLFFLATWYGSRNGLFTRDLVSPFSIAAGLFLGHVFFSLSLLMTHSVWRDAWAHFLDVRDLARFLAEVPALLLRFLAVSLAEEVIYRLAAQHMLIAWTGRPVLSILAVAVAFSLVHRHFFHNTWQQSLEFLGFAVLLGALYYATGSLSLVIVVHTLRNLESVYLEYIIKVYELGGEDEALQAIEAAYMRKPAESR